MNFQEINLSYMSQTKLKLKLSPHLLYPFVQTTVKGNIIVLTQICIYICIYVFLHIYVGNVHMAVDKG